MSCGPAVVQRRALAMEEPREKRRREARSLKNASQPMVGWLLVLFLLLFWAGAGVGVGVVAGDGDDDADADTEEDVVIGAAVGLARLRRTCWLDESESEGLCAVDGVGRDIVVNGDEAVHVVGVVVDGGAAARREEGALRVTVLVERREADASERRQMDMTGDDVDGNVWSWWLELSLLLSSSMATSEKIAKCATKG